MWIVLCCFLSLLSFAFSFFFNFEFLDVYNSVIPISVCFSVRHDGYPHRQSGAWVRMMLSQVNILDRVYYFRGSFFGARRV